MRQITEPALDTFAPMDWWVSAHNGAMLAQVEAVCLAVGLTLQITISRHGPPDWYPPIRTILLAAAAVIVLAGLFRLWLRRFDRGRRAAYRRRLGLPYRRQDVALTQMRVSS